MLSPPSPDNWPQTPTPRPGARAHRSLWQGPPDRRRRKTPPLVPDLHPVTPRSANQRLAESTALKPARVPETTPTPPSPILSVEPNRLPPVPPTAGPSSRPDINVQALGASHAELVTKYSNKNTKEAYNRGLRQYCDFLKRVGAQRPEWANAFHHVDAHTPHAIEAFLHWRGTEHDGKKGVSAGTLGQIRSSLSDHYSMLLNTTVSSSLQFAVLCSLNERYLLNKQAQQWHVTQTGECSGNPTKAANVSKYMKTRRRKAARDDDVTRQVGSLRLVH